MTEIKNAFNEDYREFISSSGLKINILFRPDFSQSTAVYGTDFGAVHLRQIVDGKLETYPSGAAHFLEHKLFEEEEGDILSQFAALGANANAFTSYFETVYYFNKQGSIFDALRLLIRFVRRLNISEESVAKEKGIILEELNMYEQMPDTVLLKETYRSIFHTYPFIYDIGGTKESVSDMTYDDLMRAYKHNYQDSKMQLFIITHEDVDSITRLIEDETRRLPLERFSVVNALEAEDISINRSEYDLYRDVQSTKTSLAYKFAYTGDNALADEFLLLLLLQSYFSYVNDDYQIWLDKEIINSEFSFDIDIRDGIGVIYFFNETEKSDEYFTLIEESLAYIKIDETTFEQLQKRYYGSCIFALSMSERLAISMARSSFRGQDYFAYLEDIRSLTYRDLKRVIPYLSNGAFARLRMFRTK